MPAAAGADLSQRGLDEAERALGTIRTGSAAAAPAARTIAAGVLLGIEPTYAKKEADEDEASEQRHPKHRQGLDRKDSKDRGDRTHIPRVRPLTHHATPTGTRPALPATTSVARPTGFEPVTFGFGRIVV